MHDTFLNERLYEALLKLCQDNRIQKLSKVNIAVHTDSKYCRRGENESTLSPRSKDGRKGTAEQALIGSPAKDINSPVEIGRTIRSFDPCISCATHIYTGGKHINTIEITH